ncbi:hypothetical protein Pmani_022760 [Petrolisthes manimaculis]|uniref:Uncharacterized protein n=1 Tax=Petrolisthes manimaculis TaxID=1843537 RepID=A0AAE1PDV6_9EUCA|nr:hypothetical protein Pmani_022760 [Petrolisthes manimaculis]
MACVQRSGTGRDGTDTMQFDSGSLTWKDRKCTREITRFESQVVATRITLEMLLCSACLDSGHTEGGVRQWASLIRQPWDVLSWYDGLELLLPFVFSLSPLLGHGGNEEEEEKEMLGEEEDEMLGEKEEEMLGEKEEEKEMLGEEEEEMLGEEEGEKEEILGEKE